MQFRIEKSPVWSEILPGDYALRRYYCLSFFLISFLQAGRPSSCIVETVCIGHYRIHSLSTSLFQYHPPPPVQLFLCCSLLISFFPFTFVSPPFAHGEQDSYIDEAIAFFNPLPGGFSYYYYSYYVLSTRSRSSTARPLHVPCSLNVQSSSFSFLPVVALILLFFCCHSLHLLIQSDHRVLFYFALVQTHRSVWEALS